MGGDGGAQAVASGPSSPRLEMEVHARALQAVRPHMMILMNACCFVCGVGLLLVMINAIPNLSALRLWEEPFDQGRLAAGACVFGGDCLFYSKHGRFCCVIFGISSFISKNILVLRIFRVPQRTLHRTYLTALAPPAPPPLTWHLRTRVIPWLCSCT